MNSNTTPVYNGSRNNRPTTHHPARKEPTSDMMDPLVPCLLVTATGTVVFGSAVAVHVATRVLCG